MTDFTNTNEGGTNGVQVSVANSGGFSGDPYAAVSNGAGGSVTYSSTAAIRGGISVLMTQPSALTNYVQIDQPAGTSGFQDSIYFYYPAHPDVTHQLVDIRYAGGGSAGGINISTTGQMSIKIGTVGQGFTAGVLTPGTVYRLEQQGASYGSAGSTSYAAQIFVMDSLTALLSQSVTTGTTTGTVISWRFGKPATSGQSNLTGIKFDDWRHRDSGGSGLGPTSPNLSAFPTVAAGTGTANDVEPLGAPGSISTTVDAQPALASGSAPFVAGTSYSVEQVVSALVAIGEAFDVTPKVGPGPLVAGATGAALDATIAGTSLVSVNSVVASATGTAFNALVLINGTSPPSVADGIGTAYDATISVVLAATDAPAVLAEVVGQAFDATVIADSGVIYFFTTPTFREKWAGRHGLWSRMYLDRGISVLRYGESYQQIDEPSAEQVTAADAAYIGGRTYRVSKAEALRLRAAGYGQWVTEAPDPEEHVEI